MGNVSTSIELDAGESAMALMNFVPNFTHSHNDGVKVTDILTQRVLLEFDSGVVHWYELFVDLVLTFLQAS